MKSSMAKDGQGWPKSASLARPKYQNHQRILSKLAESCAIMNFERNHRICSTSLPLPFFLLPKQRSIGPSFPRQLSHTFHEAPCPSWSVWLFWPQKRWNTPRWHSPLNLAGDEVGVGGICKMIFVKCPRPNVVPRSFKISQNLSKVFAFVSLKKRNTRNKETSWKMIVIHIDPMRTTQNITSTAHMILELLPSYTLVDCNEHIQISLKLRHDSEQIWAIIKKEFTFATFLAAIERMRLQL